MDFPEPLAKKYLQVACQKGDVFFWKESPLSEKESKDSYYVLLTKCVDLSSLNSLINEDGFIVVRATTRTHYYGPGAKRINHDIVFIKKGETEIFPKDTVLDLNRVRYLKKSELSKILDSRLEKKGRLDSCIVKRINECVLMSTTLSPREQKLIRQS